MARIDACTTDELINDNIGERSLEMLQLLSLAFAAAIGYLVFTSYQKFSENLVQAKQSGIPYIWTPIYVRTSPAEA